jgi:hypothetical protein
MKPIVVWLLILLDFLGLRVNKPSDLWKSSIIVLILVNLIPIFGAIFWDWKVFLILLLFWVENIAVMVVYIIKMALVKTATLKQRLSKIVVIPYFCLHFGFFTALHGFAIFVLFGGNYLFGGELPSIASLIQSIEHFQLILPIIALFASHGLLFSNYIKKHYYKQSSVNELTYEPYLRIALMQVVILGGGLLLATLGSPVYGLVLLVLVKIFIDVRAEIRQNSEYDKRSKPLQPNTEGVTVN